MNKYIILYDDAFIHTYVSVDEPSYFSFIRAESDAAAVSKMMDAMAAIIVDAEVSTFSSAVDIIEEMEETVDYKSQQLIRIESEVDVSFDSLNDKIRALKKERILAERERRSLAVVNEVERLKQRLEREKERASKYVSSEVSDDDRE